MTHHKTILSIIGSSSPSPQSLELAYQVGREAVLHGCSIASGGLCGIMEAASRGAQEAKAELVKNGQGGDLPQVIAILPSGDKNSANAFVDIVIPTGMGYTRNALVVLAGDASIALEGGSGTLSEIAYAWQFGRPVAALSSSGGWAAKLAGKSLDDKRPDRVIDAKTAVEAVERVLTCVREQA